MSTTPRRRIARRVPLVLAACLATVVAMLSSGGTPARADTCGIASPWSIVVTGPNGQSTTQPPYAQVHLLAVDAGGEPVCSGGDLSLSWSQVAGTGTVVTLGGALLDPAGDAATTESPGEGTITYQVQGRTGAGPFGGAQVTVTFTDPGPSGTTLAASPGAPTADSPVTLTADTSSPPDILRSWTWEFGDGSTASTAGNQPSVDHTYTSAGDYTATVTVTDWIGKTDSAEVPVHVAPDPVSREPLTAAFSLSPSSPATFQDVTVTDASTTDQTAPIAARSWDFGDGNVGSGATAIHQYPETGTFTITETVTDALGRTATASHPITVHDQTTPGGPPGTSGGPSAAWSLATASPVAGALTAFDGTGSAADGGTIVDYAWAFGDGQTAHGATPRHSYADGGSYPVTLTVTDDSARTASVTHLVPVAYAPPTAAFTDGPSSPAVGQAVSFDGTGSSFPAPGPASYAWSFGDGTAAAGATTTHAFPAQGSYPVTLTVTDAGGRTSSVTHVVTTQWAATDLAVSVGGSVPRAGRYAYRVTVTNLGTTAAHDVLLLNSLDPTQVLAVKASAPAGVSCRGVALGATGTIACSAGSSAVLAPGKSWVVTFTVTQPSAPRVRSVTETSHVSAANPDPLAANDTASRSTVLAVKH